MHPSIVFFKYIFCIDTSLGYEPPAELCYCQFAAADAVLTECISRRYGDPNQKKTIEYSTITSLRDSVEMHCFMHLAACSGPKRNQQKRRSEHCSVGNE